MTVQQFYISSKIVMNSQFVLCLRSNFMGDWSCLEIKKWIVESDISWGDCKLETLDFAYNSIGEKGAEYLCDALKAVNCNLTVLDLGLDYDLIQRTE